MDYSQLKRQVLEAQRIHEKTYIPGRGAYGKSQQDAANEACGEDSDAALLVWLLNAHAWNDIQDWAKS